MVSSADRTAAGAAGLQRAEPRWARLAWSGEERVQGAEAGAETLKMALIESPSFEEVFFKKRCTKS